MPRAGFEPATPATERPQTYALDRVATGIGFYLLLFLNNFQFTSLSNDKWVHCHHGMARPRIADRGDGLQIWRVAVNILNKQPRTADSGWSSSLGVGGGIKPYLIRLSICYESPRTASEQYGLFTGDALL
jgi:hypothetical protein